VHRPLLNLIIFLLKSSWLGIARMLEMIERTRVVLTSVQSVAR
jgi:hypothetical protein